jgi:hypothetical protein
VSTSLTRAIERKDRARRDWQRAPFEEKVAALIRMQAMAREMARASGRTFEGVVWKPSGIHGR